LASEQGAIWQVAFAGLVLLAFSILVLGQLRRRPWLATGWFWFLGTLVPVIGLVQVGTQAMADRYTYIPLIGIFICASWGAAWLSGSLRAGPAFASVLAVAVLAVCTFLTQRQVGYWRDNLALFGHCLEVTRNNATAECQVGKSLAEGADFTAA